MKTDNRFLECHGVSEQTDEIRFGSYYVAFKYIRLEWHGAHCLQRAASFISMN